LPEGNFAFTGFHICCAKSPKLSTQIARPESYDISIIFAGIILPLGAIVSKIFE
jgi:hypothetical protein